MGNEGCYVIKTEFKCIFADFYIFLCGILVKCTIPKRYRVFTVFNSTLSPFSYTGLLLLILPNAPMVPQPYFLHTYKPCFLKKIVESCQPALSAQTDFSLKVPLGVNFHKKYTLFCFLYTILSIKLDFSQHRDKCYEQYLNVFH